MVAAGSGLVVAQPKGETSRPAGETSEGNFELLGEHIRVNLNNVIFTRDEGGFSIFSLRAPLPEERTFTVNRCGRYYKGEIIF